MTTATTANAFDFGALKDAVGIDPFAKQTNRFPKDERFYTLQKDKNGNGAALIRFLPDSERRMIIQMQKIGTTIIKNGKKRFVNKFTPATIGLPCPFQEKWQELWNQGIKEDIKDSNGNVVQYGARTFSRGLKYVTNIKILKDPANPENEGKIFLYEMSGAMNSKLEKALTPSESDISLGKTPKQLFNPVKGNSFRLVAQMGSNNQINYDASEVVAEETNAYTSIDEAVKDINENTYKLSDLLKPESFDSYDDLVKEFKRVTFAEMDKTPTPATPVAQAVATPAPAAPVQTEAPVTPTATPVTPEPAQAAKNNDDLNAILNGLI